MINPLDLAHLYVLYLLMYILIVGSWYKKAKKMGMTADTWPTLVVVLVFIMGGPAIWVAYPLAKRSHDGK